MHRRSGKSQMRCLTWHGIAIARSRCGEVEMGLVWVVSEHDVEGMVHDEEAMERA